MKAGTAIEIYDSNPTTKILVYGETGKGKTHWACTTPNPLIILTEPQGKQTIRHMNPSAFCIEVESWQEFMMVWNQIKMAPVVERDGRTFIRLTARKWEHDFQTLVIDSITQLQRLMVVEMLGLAGK